MVWSERLNTQLERMERKFTLTLSLRDCDCYIYQGNSFLGYMIQTIRQQVMKDKCIEYKQQMQLLPMSIQSL